MFQKHVSVLKQQCGKTEACFDDLEQYGRRVCLRIDGIPLVPMVRVRVKDTSNHQRYFPTIEKDTSNQQKKYFQPSKILPTVYYGKKNCVGA